MKIPTINMTISDMISSPVKDTNIRAIFPKLSHQFSISIDVFLCKPSLHQCWLQKCVLWWPGVSLPELLHPDHLDRWRITTNLVDEHYLSNNKEMIYSHFIHDINETWRLLRDTELVLNCENVGFWLEILLHLWNNRMGMGLFDCLFAKDSDKVWNGDEYDIGLEGDWNYDVSDDYQIWFSNKYNFICSRTWSSLANIEDKQFSFQEYR